MIPSGQLPYAQGVYPLESWGPQGRRPTVTGHTDDHGSRVGENGLMSLFRYDGIAPRAPWGGVR